ncbi:MAG: fibronectin type III domain-containing protein [Spirochaetia bacterium]
MIKKYSSSILVFMTVVFLFSCGMASNSVRRQVGGADHGDGNDIGGSKDLVAPANFKIVNNGTGTETFLTLEWDSVPHATLYRVYRAVYPTRSHMAEPAAREFKLLTTVDASSAVGGKLTTQHNIPHLPLRRYAYKVTAANDDGESESTAVLTGYRVPIDQLEALKDIDYTVHFAQTSISNFGAAYKEATIHGRGGGNYFYRSNTSPKSRFQNHNDFEVVLNGDPSMSLNIFTQRVTMNGDINISGLYTGKMTYHSLLGAEGGLTKNGQVTISYNHPTKGTLTRKYNFEEIRQHMKTVAMNPVDKIAAPHKSEWNEADASYTRQMKTGRGN